MVSLKWLALLWAKSVEDFEKFVLQTKMSSERGKNVICIKGVDLSFHIEKERTIHCVLITHCSS